MCCAGILRPDFGWGKVASVKLDRLLAIVMLLLSRGRVTARDLAQRFEVSDRTIYRDIEAINRAGIPVVSRAGITGGYEIMEGFRLDRQYLSLKELRSIVTALKGVRYTLDDPDLDVLLAKVDAIAGKAEHGGFKATGAANPFVIHPNAWQTSSWDRDKFAQLRSAIQDFKCVRMTYMNAGGLLSDRVVEPISLVLKGYVWYLYAFCRLREDGRIFRLSRIKQLTILPNPFAPRGDSLEELDARWAFQDELRLVSLVLHFSERVRVRVEDHFEPAEIEGQSDGSLLVRVHYPEDSWLYGMLLSYGPDVRVLEPFHITSILKEKAQRIANLYQ